MKRGFTLVELLASIAIMALIIVISVPAYNSISNTIKTNSLNSKKSMLENATKSYIDKYHKDEVYDGDLNILLISIPYLINENVIIADDSDKKTIINPLTGGDLEGYMKVTYNLNTFEIIAEYEEFSSYKDFNDFNKTVKDYNSNLNKFIIPNKAYYSLNEENYSMLQQRLQNTNSIMIKIYKR